eukprot:c38621_g1_i1 orf=1-168(-)
MWVHIGPQHQLKLMLRSDVGACRASASATNRSKYVCYKQKTNRCLSLSIPLPLSLS